MEPSGFPSPDHRSLPTGRTVSDPLDGTPAKRAVTGRLAPSPTGAQHFGNARTFLLAWLSLRSQQGRVILRIEDIDSPRVKPWAQQQAIDDLRWLGLDWDEGPDVGGPHAPYVQTERRALYEDALRTLQLADGVYPCVCSRSDVAAAASAPHEGGEGPIYPRTCQAHTAATAEQLGGQPYAWRLRTDDRLLSWNDLVQGGQSGHVASELGDFIVAKADGSPAYQLAVVVDDHAMGITEVVRGSDLMPSTLRQLFLFDQWGWEPPRYGHVPLVVGPDGRRLAKRHGDTRLSTLRAAGGSAERLIGLLAWSAGLLDRPEPVTAHELLCDFAQFPPLGDGPFVFDATLWWPWLCGESATAPSPRRSHAPPRR
ncbi:MAG: tRNA glutamyl-Q(34) synthetase GluQRS [Pirellulales bacterium]